MNIRQFLACAALMLATGLAWAQDKVVYHVSDTDSQALAALRNVRNHLDTDPTAKIIIVTHAQGVDLPAAPPLDGAAGRADEEWAGAGPGSAPALHSSLSANKRLNEWVNCRETRWER